jgi:putative acetyltransferase
MSMFEIIPFDIKYASDFKRLNLEWLEKYNLTESHDLYYLDDPQKTIIDKGGYIWLAKVDEHIVGSAAIMKDTEDVYELSKMSVTESYQGKGIGKKLMETCLEKSRELKVKKLYLFSNHQLQGAIGMYIKFGFIHVDVKDSPFETADIKMELILE